MLSLNRKAEGRIVIICAMVLCAFGFGWILAANHVDQKSEAFVEEPPSRPVAYKMMKVWHGVAFYSEIEGYLNPAGEFISHGAATMYSIDMTPCVRMWFDHGDYLRSESWEWCSGEPEDLHDLKLKGVDLLSMLMRLNGRDAKDRRTEVVDL